MMNGLTKKLLDWTNRKPTRLPVIVSAAGLVLATTLASLLVAFGLNHNGPLFIVMTIVIACTVAGPAGYIHYQREKQIAAQQEALHLLASTDGLTGALNRRSFQTAILKEQRRMRRTGESAAMILLDLDWFKSINDTFGHSVGDEVLLRVAEAARKELRRPFDAMARWGGEEFAILLSNVTLEQGVSIAERLRRKLAGMSFSEFAPGLSITASFGVSELTAHSNFDKALVDADRALYDAKNAGRNRTMSAKAHGRQLTPLMLGVSA